jgi:hypothetical protein
MLKNFIPEFIKAPLRSRLHKKRLFRSQAGQDLWVFGEVFNEQRSGFFLDIGAHDGVVLSNTYVLENRYDWRGICIEANPDTFEELKKIDGANASMRVSMRSRAQLHLLKGACLEG